MQDRKQLVAVRSKAKFSDDFKGDAVRQISKRDYLSGSQLRARILRPERGCSWRCRALRGSDALSFSPVAQDGDGEGGCGMTPLGEWGDKQPANLIANYQRLGKMDDAYYLGALSEMASRKGGGLDFDKTFRAVLKAAKECRFTLLRPMPSVPSGPMGNRKPKKPEARYSSCGRDVWGKLRLSAVTFETSANAVSQSPLPLEMSFETSIAADARRSRIAHHERPD